MWERFKYHAGVAEVAALASILMVTLSLFLTGYFTVNPASYGPVLLVPVASIALALGAIGGVYYLVTGLGLGLTRDKNGKRRLRIDFSPKLIVAAVLLAIAYVALGYLAGWPLPGLVDLTLVKPEGLISQTGWIGILYVAMVVLGAARFLVRLVIKRRSGVSPAQHPRGDSPYAARSSFDG